MKIIYCDFFFYNLEFLEIKKNGKFREEWRHTEIDRKECGKFAEFLKERLKYNTKGCIEISDVKPSIKILKSQLLGCCSECPLCKTKCQNDKPAHVGDHCSPFHLLRAFNGAQMSNIDDEFQNNQAKIPCIDVCNSRANEQSDWIYNSKWSNFARVFNSNWGKYNWKDVRLYYEKEFCWKFDGDLDEDFLVSLLDMYFNKGLQDRMMENQTNWTFARKRNDIGFDWKHCVKADKTKDVLFADQINFQEYGIRNGKERVKTAVFY